MLQWMGGSRRKVTTSRKSTLQRQKQYFEQRKRQQQQTDGLESYSDRKRSCTPHYKSNRSLDILSLVNLSTVAQEHKTSGTNEARDSSEDDDCTLNHQYGHPSLDILTNKGTPQCQSEITEERIPLSQATEAEDSKKVSVHLPDYSEDFAGNRNKLDPFKLSTTHQISLIDLLDYGGGNSNAEENSVRMQEAHVAFSVEGLGKVEIETPVQSPKMPGRSFQNGFSTPSKATRQPITRKATKQPITFKHLDYGFHDLGSQVDIYEMDKLQDVMMQDIQLSPYDSSIEQPLCSRNVENINGEPYQKSLNFAKSSPFNWNCKNSLGVFANDELIYNIGDSSKTTWNGGRFLDDSIDDLGVYGSFRKNWVDKRKFDHDDYFHSNDLWKQDINLEGWDLKKKSSSTRGTEKFDMGVSPFPYTKHHIMEDLPDGIIPDAKWYSDKGIDIDVTNDPNQFAREDSNENLSLPSEESCSSTAVRADVTKKSREAKDGRKSHHSK